MTATANAARIALVATFAAALALAGAPAADARPGGALVPASGALFGAYVDPDARWTDEASARAEVTALESQIGRRLAIDHHYYAWTGTFPTGLERFDLDAGRIPLISWHGTALSSILSGTHDAMIRERADAVAALGKPVFLRWGWEMNGNWYAWDGSHNNDAGQTNGPAKYRAAWRRIHGIFRARGATNVVWVWSPNHANVPTSSWNHWRNYYPGDAYVDWVGIDGYNWGSTRSWSRWTSFTSIFAPVYDDFAARKPVMIAEFSSAERGGSKGDWIAAARSALKSRFPSVAAVLWFHVNKETDWRATSSSAALTAYRSMGADAYFARPGSAAAAAGVAPRVTSLNASPPRIADRSVIAFRLNTGAITSVWVRRVSTGSVVRRLRQDVTYAAGPHYVAWNRLNDQGIPVADGTYQVEVRARNAAGRTLALLRVVAV